jgi:hypothetical protein
MKTKIDIRNILILILSIALYLAVDACSNAQKVVDVKLKTEIKTEVKQKTERIKDSDFSKPDPVKVAIKDNKAKEVSKYYKPSQADSNIVVLDVNKYRKEYNLPNGQIKAIMLTTGEMIELDLELTTRDSIITRETTIEKIVAQSGFYYGGQAVLGFNGRIKDVQADVSYMHKNLWILRGGLQYDTDPYIELPIEYRTGIIIGFARRF